MGLLRARGRGAAPAALATLCAVAALAAARAELPVLSIGGFSWLENLVFDGLGGLWMSEASRGELWRVSVGADGASYNASRVLSGFQHVDGLAVSDDGRTLFAVAQESNSSRGGPSLVLSLSTQEPRVGEYRVVARTPELPNGMKRDLVTGKLYLSVEGKDFLPGQGKVYEVDPASGSVRTIMSGFFWSDGLAIDNVRRVLYVGELMTGKIFTYDLEAGKATGSFKDGQNPWMLQWLDDFMVSPDCRTLIGASYRRGDIVSMPVGGGGSSKVLFKGLTNPTAVLFGAGPGFRTTSLYVTEGGSFDPKNTQRRIVEIPNARAPPAAGTDKCFNYLAGRA